MKSRDMIKKYGIDESDFEDFMIRNGLEYDENFVGFSVDDDKVEEYMTMYREWALLKNEPKKRAALEQKRIKAKEDMASEKKSEKERQRAEIRKSMETAAEKVQNISQSSEDQIQEEQEPEIGNGIPVFFACIFMIASLILYFVSVNNSYGVANIQTTVFSAAAFVCCVVCFCASRIIRAINSKK